MKIPLITNEMYEQYQQDKEVNKVKTQIVCFARMVKGSPFSKYYDENYVSAEMDYEKLKETIEKTLSEIEHHDQIKYQIIKFDTENCYSYELTFTPYYLQG